WNDGVSFPIHAGHGCLGCSEDGVWDYGYFYCRATGIPQTGIEATDDKIGLGDTGVASAAAKSHATEIAIKHTRKKNNTT
ncbi:hydrogenase small subunit, partial [Salmonella enterica subsp. enterica serovar Infantis]